MHVEHEAHMKCRAALAASGDGEVLAVHHTETRGGVKALTDKNPESVVQLEIALPELEIGTPVTVIVARKGE